MMDKKTLGITRGRFSELMRIKGKKSLSKKRFSKTTLRKTYENETDLINSTLLSSSTKTSEIEMNDLSQPGWMDDYRRCCRILCEVDTIKQDIKKEQRKKITAINEEKHNELIQKFTHQATIKISECEKVLKGMESVREFNEAPEERKSSCQIRVVFTNMMMSLAMKMREKTKELRANQQEELSRTRQIEDFQRGMIDPDSAVMQKDEDDFTQIQGQEFEQLQEKMIKERNEEIIQIVKSIASLNTIYKQLQQLVIHQGSLLDRIDENIDHTFSNIKSANQSLKQAQQHQKSTCARKVIFILVFLIMLFLLIFLIK